MTDVTVEFMGGPLDGTTGSVRATRTGRPPDRFAVDTSAEGGATRGKHDYRVGAEPQAGMPWRYEYNGVRPG
ncbi:MAG: hypothetical protein V7603_5887 [Micromonosporaceae bacterium]